MRFWRPNNTLAFKAAKEIKVILKAISYLQKYLSDCLLFLSDLSLFSKVSDMSNSSNQNSVMIENITQVRLHLFLLFNIQTKNKMFKCISSTLCFLIYNFEALECWVWVKAIYVQHKGALAAPVMHMLRQFLHLSHKSPIQTYFTQILALFSKYSSHILLF